MSFADLFSGHAGLYAAARPAYPAALFDWIASVAPRNGRVWDCGCGNGQAAVGLAEHFLEVCASDPSAAQIANMRPHPRVQYSVQPAERVDYAPDSFDAVCVAQALHWFDIEGFYAELRRVLRADGIVVVWGYDWFAVDPAFDAGFQAGFKALTQPYWDPRLALVWNGYRDIPFPFEPIAAPSFAMELDWDFATLMRYVATWSAVQRYLAAHGDAAPARLVAQLAPLWGEPDRVRRVRMPIHLRAGRNAAAIG